MLLIKQFDSYAELPMIPQIKGRMHNAMSFQGISTRISNYSKSTSQPSHHAKFETSQNLSSKDLFPKMSDTLLNSVKHVPVKK